MTAEEGFDRIRAWFGIALRAVDPERAVLAHLSLSHGGVTISGRSVDCSGRIVVCAVGKAATPMARAAEGALGNRIFAGIALTKDGHSGGAPLAVTQTKEASHPIPDERGVAATIEILEMLSGLTEDDLVIALISGGGSALLEAPVDGVSLADVAAVTSLLLRAGAPIDDLNAVRIPLSRVKGGGLRAATAAKFSTLILSDVLGNDSRVIASGPTVQGAADGDGALAVLRAYHLSELAPPAVIKALSRRRAPTLSGRGDLVTVIADNRTAVDAFAEAATNEGMAPRICWSGREGEAREVAKDWVGQLTGVSGGRLLLGGGEATVTVRGDGEGGRNTEFALAAALELEARDLNRWVVASLATDGQDGPTGMAGAMATSQTVERSRAAGIDPADALARNDSLAVFRAAGGLVKTGPTGTNVNDIYVALRLD